MEEKAKHRKLQRLLFKDIAAELTKKLEEGRSGPDILVPWKQLQWKFEILKTVDHQIYELLLVDQDRTEEDILQNIRECSTYEGTFLTLQLKVESIVQISSSGSDDTSEDGQQLKSRRKYKLPAIEFKKFDDNIKNWLPFWAQFKKIDVDEDIDVEDKIEYLRLAMHPSSRARALVESYPAVGTNYKKILGALKARYGREDLLIEVQVRELLKLVLKNSIAGSKIEVSSFFDELETYIRTLETLGITSDKCGPMLFPLVESCLPEELMRVWQRSSYTPSDKEFEPEETMSYEKRLAYLMNFLRKELENEQKFALTNDRFGMTKFKKNEKFPAAAERISTAAGLVHQDHSSLCLFCDKSHDTIFCFKASKWTLERKKQAVESKRACYHCLRRGHPSWKCKSGVVCLICHGKHVTLMCPTLSKSQRLVEQHGNRTGDQKQFKSSTAEQTPTRFERKAYDGKADETQTTTNNTSSHVFLQTLKVTLKGTDHDEKVRVLIDTGSQNTYILRSTADRLGYTPGAEEKILHSLFGGKRVLNSHRRYEIVVHHEKYMCTFEALSHDTICNDVVPVFHGPWIDELHDLNIEVSDSGGVAPIEVLIGSDVAGRLYTGRKHVLKCGLVVMETLLGWTLMGKIPLQEYSKTCLAMSLLSTGDNSDIEQLWKLDTIGIGDPGERRSQEEATLKARQDFVQTTKTDVEGRYEVHLTWLQDHAFLPNNYHLAKRRLSTTIKKLKEDDLLADYNAVFEEWLSEGIVEIVQETCMPHNAHYLPHRAVVKQSSATTKIRPVFDASARTKGNPSLNQCLEKGVNLIELIPNILIGFRKERIGVTSDIRKAFLQISVNEEDRDSLRFLWTDDNGEEVVLRHRRVVFGLTCSPFLLGATIEHHLVSARNDKEKLGNCISLENLRKLSTSFYVDNCVTSVVDENSLKQFIEESSMIMNRGKFDLRGWEHNVFPEQDSTCSSNTTPILGLQWERSSDTISINPDIFKDTHRISEQPITKRTMLSMAQRIFDPIGFTCPATLLPKVLLQKMWELKIGWDVPVSGNLCDDYTNWLKEIDCLQNVKIPRWFGLNFSQAEWTLHTFCDASKHAYSAVIFLRGKDGDQVHVRLIAAKSRVAPLKKLTIPRLELMAAVIGSRLSSSLKSSFKRNVREFYWSDSTTVLTWIKREENWNVFIANRIAEIRRLTSADSWNHVAGTDNPADLSSRGVSPRDLEKSKWWEGPSWLKQDESGWPSTCVSTDESEVNQERRSKPNLLISKSFDWHVERFSKYRSLVRMMAWIFRFINNARLANRQSGELTTEEYEKAEHFILKLIQQEEFAGLEDSRLSNLRSFEDEVGLIRLKTRISERNDIDVFRFPIVLPAKHTVVEKLIYDTHVRMCHTRTQGLMAELRERFWILGGRRAINSVISRCVVCKRHNSKPFITNETPLPVNRVRDAAAFEITGIDFTGPLHIRGGGKVWICVFTCAVYRAVHFELCTSLSAVDFVKALRRFTSRRGRPAMIYSDNATNFQKTAKDLRTIDWESVMRSTSVDRITWRFNPPAAPWWGGFWERLIGVLKTLLRKILGKAFVSYEDLLTLLCECESVINSRPLTYLSNDSEELTALTPTMFLRERTAEGIPNDDQQLDVAAFNRRIKYLQRLRELLRSRFRREYLGQLTLLQKRRTSRPITVGEIVIIETQHEKKINWPLGRIVEIYPGKDGEVRLASVETSRGKLLRPVQCLYPLECTSEKNSREDAEVSSEKVTRSGRVIKMPKRFM